MEDTQKIILELINNVIRESKKKAFKRGNHGFVDLIIQKGDYPFIGIEVEYPRGEGLRNIQNFRSHLRSDLLKLNSEPFTFRYLLVFLYNDPPFDYRGAIYSLNFGKVHFACIRLCRRDELEGEKAVKESIIIPDNWITV